MDKLNDTVLLFTRISVLNHLPITSYGYDDSP
jgi:hypothetical protein